MPGTSADAPGGRRERPGTDEAVRAVGPPPVPVLPAPWDIRLAAPGGTDLDLVHRWMNLPHVADRWQQAWSRECWAEELAGQLAGSFSRPLLLASGDEPVAYVELYRAAWDVVADHHPFGPDDLGIHLAIGDPGRTGRGLGAAVLETVSDGCFAADPRCRQVACEPDVANLAMRGACRRAGFTLTGEVDLPHKRAALLVRRRPVSGR